jgi:GntR family transcriptional regulator
MKEFQMRTNESFIPIYYRLAEDIKEQIISGILKAGDMIPSESQLCSQYNITKMTARQGLRLLNEEGLIESFRGKGSFVKQPKFKELILELPDSHYNTLNESNMKLLGVDVIIADNTIASILKLRAGSKVIRFSKLYFEENKPIAVDKRFIIYHRGQPVIEEEIHYAAFPEVVAQHTGLITTRNQVTLSAISIDKETAQLLKTNQNTPGLKIEQLVFGVQDQPLGCSIIICEGERYKLNALTKTFFQ